MLHQLVGRATEKFFDRLVGQHAATAHQHDGIGQGAGLALVVQAHQQLALLTQCAQPLNHGVGIGLAQASRGLVDHQQTRAGGHLRQDEEGALHVQRAVHQRGIEPCGPGSLTVFGQQLGGPLTPGGRAAHSIGGRYGLAQHLQHGLVEQAHLLLHQCGPIVVIQGGSVQAGQPPGAVQGVALIQTGQGAKQGGLPGLDRPHQHVDAARSQMQLHLGQHHTLAESDTETVESQFTERARWGRHEDDLKNGGNTASVTTPGKAHGKAATDQKQASSAGIAIRALVSAMPRLADLRQTNTAT